jgi:hypothetical protein
MIFENFQFGGSRRVGLGRFTAGWIAVTAALLALAFLSTSAAVAQTKPNIVFILADDLRHHNRCSF